MRTPSFCACVLAVASSVAVGGRIFQDDFDTFALGATWQGTTWGGTSGAPTTLIGGASYNGAIALEVAGTGSGAMRGIELINPLDVTGALSLTLDVRTSASNFSYPVEVSLRGETGAWMRMFYTYTAWTNNYDDSSGNAVSWGGWFGGMQPDYYRRYFMNVTDTGVDVAIYDEPGNLRWAQSFGGLSVSDFGNSVDVAIRQLDDHWATRIWVDYVSVSAVTPEPTTLTLLGLGLAAMVRRRRR